MVAPPLSEALHALSNVPSISSRASQRENVKLREIAQRIVERQPLGPPPEG